MIDDEQKRIDAVIERNKAVVSSAEKVARQLDEQRNDIIAAVRKLINECCHKLDLYRYEYAFTRSEEYEHGDRPKVEDVLTGDLVPSADGIPESPLNAIIRDLRKDEQTFRKKAIWMKKEIIEMQGLCSDRVEQEIQSIEQEANQNSNRKVWLESRSDHQEAAEDE